MLTKTVNLYTFEELDDETKRKAIEKLYDINTECGWWDWDFDNFKTIAALIGIDIDKIYFSGFFSQGDGACFEGSYSYKKGGLKALIEYAPQDECLHGIARNLQATQRKAFYQLSANVSHRGHYYHERSTIISVSDLDDILSGEFLTNLSDEVSEELRDFMQWIYPQLNKQYEYLTSEEAIIETIEANEYTFNLKGEIES